MNLRVTVKKYIVWVCAFVLSTALLCGCDVYTPGTYTILSSDGITWNIPEYTGGAHIELNGNKPYFTDNDYSLVSFEEYGDLDRLGRCTYAFANLCTDTMPSKPRESIGMIKPSGWQISKYDFVGGKYLYNRCHLNRLQQSGANANE